MEHAVIYLLIGASIAFNAVFSYLLVKRTQNRVVEYVPIPETKPTGSFDPKPIPTPTVETITAELLSGSFDSGSIPTPLSYTAHTDRQQPNLKRTKKTTNVWSLDIDPPANTEYVISVTWSDGSVDLYSGKGHETKRSTRSREIHPEKTVVISPKNDVNVVINWSLNGFHWS